MGMGVGAAVATGAVLGMEAAMLVTEDVAPN